MTTLTPDQLSKNAQLINAAHRAVVQANKTSIEKAIEAGTILKACKCPSENILNPLNRL
jgi:hypothetical protein